MTRGGARNRSGPQKDPNSARSDRAHFKLDALPAEGYRGSVPEFPLPRRVVKEWVSEGKERWQETDAAATDGVAARELELWEWAWRTPQACAWALPSESWRLHSIAMWVRTFVLCESGEATAADRNSLHRFADQIGMTPAGLVENGWAVAKDEVAAKAADKQEAAESPKPERRLRAVPGGKS